MTPEYVWLTATAAFTSLLWAPHILQRIIEMGVHDAFRDPTHEIATQAPFARRAIRAHANAVENLAVFGPLVLLVVTTGRGDGLTAGAAAAYFWSRVAHYAIYVGAVPWLRTPVFLFGWGCLWVFVLRLCGWI
jgi:uncharacterized MAPEG superfamily protein